MKRSDNDGPQRPTPTDTATVLKICNLHVLVRPPTHTPFLKGVRKGRKASRR